jgi:alpha-beta hydrolase superfamily lysophospholipase
MRHTTGSFTGLNNVTLFTQQWFPDDEPRAVVLLSHGLGEHSGRYEHVAAHLVAHGYAACALDHRGHGRSAGPRVQVNDFDEFVADLRVYFDAIRADHPGLPIFLYGHSMGSLIALLFALRYPDDLAGLITTGTALRLMAANAVTIPLIKTLGGLVPSLRLLPVDPRGVSRDPVVVRRYREDPLVYHGGVPAGMVAAMQRAAERCAGGLPSLRAPYLALHGRDDPLIPAESAEIIRRECGASDFTVKVYDSLRHEIHNEPEQAQVLDDITGWLDAHLPV